MRFRRIQYLGSLLAVHVSLSKRFMEFQNNIILKSETEEKPPSRFVLPNK